MVKEIITINNATGLHTRPAKRLVAEARQFSSTISIQFGEKMADVKSLLKIMKLGIGSNSQIELSCEGDDEDIASKHMKDFLLNLED